MHTRIKKSVVGFLGTIEMAAAFGAAITIVIFFLFFVLPLVALVGILMTMAFLVIYLLPRPTWSALWQPFWMTVGVIGCLILYHFYKIEADLSGWQIAEGIAGLVAVCLGAFFSFTHWVPGTKTPQIH